MEKELKDMDDIKELVDLKIWSTNRDKHYGAVRVKIDSQYAVQRIKRKLASKSIKAFV